MNGPQTFIRYALPPNALGYCGPEDHAALTDYSTAGVTDPGLSQLIYEFDGAFPYLELIAQAAGIADPLDHRVVEAYWVGGELLSRLPMPKLGDSLTDRFRGRAGRDWDRIAEAVWAGGRAHHSFHVLAVYPWVGLLRQGRTEVPMHVLESCLIRWGRVESAEGTTVVVDVAPLELVDGQISWGHPRTETFFASAIEPVAVGDWVSVHWGRLCARLTGRQVADLRAITGHHLRLVNRELSIPVGAAVG